MRVAEKKNKHIYQSQRCCRQAGDVGMETVQTPRGSIDAASVQIWPPQQTKVRAKLQYAAKKRENRASV